MQPSVAVSLLPATSHPGFTVTQQSLKELPAMQQIKHLLRCKALYISIAAQES